MNEMTEIEVVINVVRPSGHKVNMHRWTLDVENGAAAEEKLAEIIPTLGRVTKERAGFG